MASVSVKPAVLLGAGCSRNTLEDPMSAFGGKADVIQDVAECPLIATSGHSAQLTGAAAVKEMLEAADMACYHQKTGPEGPVSLTGRIQKGPKTQSAGRNARFFFYGFFREMQQDFVVSEKKNTAYSISAHMLPTLADLSACPKNGLICGVERTSPLATPVNESMT